MLLAITWGLVGGILGVSSFILVPWALAFLGGVEMRDRVGRYYIKQMMVVLGDATMGVAKQGGVAIASVSYDPDFAADKVTVDGETGHIADTLNVKSRLANKPFGLSLGPEYISPLFAEFAEYARDAEAESRVNAATDGGVRLDFEIPETPTIPDLRGTDRFFEGDAERRFGLLSKSWAIKSQEKFGKRISLGQTLVLMGAFAVGSGMAILTMKYGTGGGGGGVSVPIQVGLTAAGVGA